MNHKWLRPDAPVRAAEVALRNAGAFLLRCSHKVDSIRFLSGQTLGLLDRNRKFHNRHQGRRAFVLGNGPSLNRHDLGLLKSEVVLVSNGFACHPILQSWQPEVLGLCDPLYFEHPDEFAGEFKKMRERLRCDFFAPIAAREVISERGLLPLERCYYHYGYGSMADHPLWTLDLARPMPSGQTVTLLLICIALYMGCDPVYLLGMDHDFLASPKKQTHFSEDYEFGVNVPMYPSMSYLELMDACRLMWRGYEHVKRVASQRGQRVFNASEGGFLDVIPRVEYTKLFR